MNRSVCSKKQFIIYIIAAFGIAYLTQGISCVFAQKGNVAAFTMLNTLTMLAPTCAVLIAQRSLRGLGWKPRFKGRVLYYIGAWFSPAIFMILGAVLFFLVFPHTFDISGTYLKRTLEATVGEGWEAQYDMLVSAGLTPVRYALIGLIQAITYVPLINGVFALGEEIGWRGYMYPYLKDRFGTAKGRIIGGIIWGIWHWPLIIFAGYEYGTDYLGAPVAGPVAFCLIATVFGIVLDFFYEKTECILVPAIAHGAINGAASIPMIVFDPEYSELSILGPVSVGVISIIPMLIFALVVLKYTNKSETIREASENEA